ncbi:MAG: divergent polysaccharide deacetylase family protein [Thermodesulfobacteriota bacterium]|nr:divergent polysaccharide deacetylase family protein [Thermodesulfobacteriota bacterium]
MATKKKQKRRRREKRIDKKYPLIILAIFLCIIIALTFILLQFSTTSRISTTPPIYEEARPISSELYDEIGRIDNAIYDSLYEGDIPEKNIFFMAVNPKKEGEDHWEFTDILVELSDKNSLVKLGKIFEIELAPLESVAIYNKERISNREIAYHIFTLGYYTHKIRLIFEDRQKKRLKHTLRIAIIIDDLGYDLDIAKSFIELDLPLSFSILPMAPYTKVIVDEVNEKGREIILHLPMEPKNYPSLNPGPGALLMHMDKTDIRRMLSSHLEQIPGVQGINNHMGSCFTESREKMAIILNELKKQNLFFIDSVTTTHSVGFKLAKKIGVRAARRNVFLDNELSPKGIKFQVERLLGIARHSGAAIGIGHPHKRTLKILKMYLPKIKAEFEIVPVSDLVS